MNNIQAVSDFLNFHPYEFIVIKIQAEEALTTEQKKLFVS